MRRSEVLDILRAHRSELAELGITSLAIFGSVARDEATDVSDVDLLVEVQRPCGLLKFLALQDHLASLLGRSVDLATPEAIRPELRLQIERDVLYV